MEIPVLLCRDRILRTLTTKITSDDQQLQTGQQTIEKGKETSRTIECHVMVNLRLYKFLQIDQDKRIVKIYNNNSSFQVNDEIISVNGRSMERCLADDVANAFASCLLVENRPVYKRLFVVNAKRQRTDNRSEEYQSCVFVNSRCEMVKYERRRKPYLIQTVSRNMCRHQEQFVKRENNRLTTDILSNEATQDRDLFLFTLGKDTISFRYPFGSRTGVTIWWGDMCLQCNRNRDLFFQGKRWTDSPKLEEQFLMTKDDNLRTAFESVSYPGYFITVGPDKLRLTDQSPNAIPIECRFVLFAEELLSGTEFFNNRH